MFESESLPQAQEVLWSRLEPGMIFIDGLQINGTIPEEFRDYPVLNSSMISNLRQKYRLRKDRHVRVLTPDSNMLSPNECVDAINRTDRKLKVLNGFRQTVRGQYNDFAIPAHTALKSFLVQNDSLIFPFGHAPRQPSLLNRLDHAVGIADVLTKTVAAEYNFPAEKPIRIHLVADYSYSMKITGRDVYVQSALNLFYTYLKKLLPLAEFRLYGFSDECREIQYPVTGVEIPRKETHYESFIRKVLHHADRGIPDVVLLLTDGLPTDFNAAMKRLKVFPGLKIDYIQCIFNIEGDKREIGEGSDLETLDGYITDENPDTRCLSDAEYTKLMKDIKRDHSELAETAKGCQVILHVDKALSLVSVECFDRWLGSLE